MVEVKDWVTGAGIDVVAWVATDSVVAAAVDADLGMQSVWCISRRGMVDMYAYIASTRHTLHAHLEVVDILRLGDKIEH